MPKAIPRLYDSFKSEHYGITVTIDKHKRTIKGTVTIIGLVTKRPSNRITLHQKNIKILSAKVIKQDKKGEIELEVDRINNHQKANEARLHTKEKVFPGKYRLEVEFESIISDTEMLGVYESTIHDGKKEAIIVATQFESHHARKFIPCIDEPSAKATFQLTITTDKSDVVLSNTNETKVSEKGTKKTVVFDKTPKMSPYLLAFVIGDLHSIEAKAKCGTVIRSWASTTRPKKLLQYSVDEAVKVLNFFSDYFQTPYPLEKLDLVALPDFDAGAMENWGLTTYREIVLLADPDNRSISTEQYVSLVVAHELSHQWFGDLVTMAWWDDLWLNESFASFMEHLALDAIHPDWQQWEFYTSSDVLSTTSRDIYRDIQPIIVDVTDPEMIDSLFDPGIVYAKGGRLLKMLHDYIGDKAFRDGLKLYFDKFAYQNTTRDDLWECFHITSGKKVAELMDPWLTQAGMPILSVSQDGNKTKLQQSRYLIDNHSDDKTVWPIPLLTNKPGDLEIFSQEIGEVEASESTIFNPEGSGHYFVNYSDKPHFDAVAKSLESDTISPSGQINVLNDVYMLSKIDKSSLVDALKLVIANKEETRDAVWSQMLRIINTCSVLTHDDKTIEKQLKNLKQTLATPHFANLGWDEKSDDSPNEKQLRRTILAMMISADNKAVLDEADKRYKQAKSIDDIPAETRGLILSVQVRENGEPFALGLLKEYKHATPEVQMDITSALSSTRDKKVAKTIIDIALSDDFVKPQDIHRWIALFVRNLHVNKIMWDFAFKNWDWIVKKIGASKSFDYVPLYFSSGISTNSGREKFEKLFGPHAENKMLEQNIKISRVDIESKIAWRARDEQKIKDFLKIQ
jgi:aminopeptidase N